MPYYLPQRSGGEECKVPLSREKIGEMESHLEDDDPLSDDTRLHQDYFHFVMESEHFFYPNTPDEAYDLFQKLVIGNR